MVRMHQKKHKYGKSAVMENLKTLLFVFNISNWMTTKTMSKWRGKLKETSFFFSIMLFIE